MSGQVLELGQPQVGDGDEVATRAEAAGGALGLLQQAIHRLTKALERLSVMPRTTPRSAWSTCNPVLTELQSQADVLAWFGALNSLAMLLLKFTVPGVPDLYQGNEVMDLSLVDPDNRRALDYEMRRRMLDELEALSRQPDWRPGLAAMAAAPHDGRLKLWLTWRLLQLRQQKPALMRDGGYAALHAVGTHKDHVVAFMRELAGQRLVVATGRWFARLLGAQPGWPVGDSVWGDTAVELAGWPAGDGLINLLTGERVRLAEGSLLPLSTLFETLPFAAVERSVKAAEGLDWDEVR